MHNRTINTSNISDIKSKKVRNLLRGIISETDSYKIKKTLEKIKKNHSENDYNLAIEVIRESGLFKKNTVARDFNSSAPKIISDLEKHPIEDIVKKINSHETKINQLIELHIKTLNLIQTKDFIDSLEVCSEIAKAKGVSCFLIRILFYIKNQIEYGTYDDQVSKTIDEIFIKIKLDNVRHLENAIREIENPRTDYFNISEKINNSASNGTLNYIAKSFVNHVPKNKEHFFNTLNAYYSFSLIDSFLYYISSQRIELPYTKASIPISKSLENAFKSLSNININPEYCEYDKDEGMYTSFFRESFLLIELSEYFKYKTIHGSLYNNSETKEQERTSFENRLLKDYFKRANSINELCQVDNNAKSVNLDEYNPKHCTTFENSNALLFVCEKNDGDINGYDDEFVRLMSYTIDIGYIFPGYYFQKIFNNAKSDELKLVIACLMSIKDNSQIVEHNLRRIIQEITVSKFSSKIKNLVEYLNDISPSVTYHLVQICDETFLSKLFYITEKPNNAIEDRAEILEWYGKVTNEPAYIDRARNLKTDVQINKEKGNIDDSRIYVDPVKYTQWISNNVLSNITLLLETTNENLAISNINVEWNKANTGIAFKEQMASFILQCYSEFCNNNLFGIASYLGRRIRHGTFKGTGLKEVKDVSNDEKYKTIFECSGFLEHYEEWIKSYEEMLDELKSVYLHINSKRKPLGMIYSDFNTSTKKTIANAMIIDILDVYLSNENALEIPYIITEYCWRIIEEDLANIRKFLMEKKSKHAVFGFDCDNAKEIEIKEIRSFCQELNSVTTEKFRTISSWFNKPSIASPSADLNLLFKAVVSEIKGLFASYEPTIELDENDFKISGGVYFAIYDALYIMIFNAAKYGKENGILQFDVNYNSDEQIITISLTSEVASNKELRNSEKLINTALNADFENAHIVEGYSGIKKLRRMEKDLYISNLRYEFNNKKVMASFNFNMEY